MYPIQEAEAWLAKMEGVEVNFDDMYDELCASVGHVRNLLQILRAQNYLNA